MSQDVSLKTKIDIYWAVDFWLNYHIFLLTIFLKKAFSGRVFPVSNMRQILKLFRATSIITINSLGFFSGGVIQSDPTWIRGFPDKRFRVKLKMNINYNYSRSYTLKSLNKYKYSIFIFNLPNNNSGALLLKWKVNHGHTDLVKSYVIKYLYACGY